MPDNMNQFQRKTALEHLNNIIATQARIATADFDLNNFMQLVVEQVQNLTPATGAVVELVEGEEMVYHAATGSVKKHMGLRLAKENSISGLCVKEQKILRSDDTEADPRVNPAACRLVGARSLIVAPLFHEGKTVGVIKVLSRVPAAFNEDDVQTLQLMAGLIGSALAHQMHHHKTEKLLEERTRALAESTKSAVKLQYMANYDSLTDLPNRTFFREKLHTTMGQMQRNNDLIAILFLDIDHFKGINDTYGHDIGDELLKAFARRIKRSIRETDTAARIGGDEFIILLQNIQNEENAVNIAKKIIYHMQDNFRFKNLTLKITTSIGIAFLKNKNLKADELIKQADIALYAAKLAGKNNYKIYEET